MSDISVVVRGIIVKENSIFLCRQGNKDYWSLPGGHLVFGETLVECLEREIFEEFNLNVIVGEMIYIREMISKRNHRVEFYFDVNISDAFSIKSDSNLEENNEIEEFNFFTLEELKKRIIRYKPKALLSIAKENIPKYTGVIKHLGKIK